MAGEVVLVLGPGLDLGGPAVLQPAVGVVDLDAVQGLDDVGDAARRVGRPLGGTGAGGGRQRQQGEDQGETTSHAWIFAAWG